MKIAIGLALSLSVHGMEATTETSAKVLTIDIDNIDWVVFQEIVETCGSFELAGKSMVRLVQYVTLEKVISRKTRQQPQKKRPFSLT